MFATKRSLHWMAANECNGETIGQTLNHKSQSSATCKRQPIERMERVARQRNRERARMRTKSMAWEVIVKRWKSANRTTNVDMKLCFLFGRPFCTRRAHTYRKRRANYCTKYHTSANKLRFSSLNTLFIICLAAQIRYFYSVSEAFYGQGASEWESGK